MAMTRHVVPIGATTTFTSGSGPPRVTTRAQASASVEYWATSSADRGPPSSGSLSAVVRGVVEPQSFAAPALDPNRGWMPSTDAAASWLHACTALAHSSTTGPAASSGGRTYSTSGSAARRKPLPDSEAVHV